MLRARWHHMAFGVLWWLLVLGPALFVPVALGWALVAGSRTSLWGLGGLAAWVLAARWGLGRLARLMGSTNDDPIGLRRRRPETARGRASSRHQPPSMLAQTAIIL